MNGHCKATEINDLEEGITFMEELIRRGLIMAGLLVREDFIFSCSWIVRSAGFQEDFLRVLILEPL